MHFESFLALVALALAYTFDFVNGFHDTANAIATVIYTKALRPNTAILMSGLLNFAGCLLIGTAVAQVITEVIPQGHLSLSIILAVLLASLTWNIYTWYHGIPVSSSHCLIGGLFGVGLAAGGINGVSWSKLYEVITALALSPIIGFIGGLIFTAGADKLVKSLPAMGQPARNGQPQYMRWLQIFSSCAVSFTHGSNDGQKTMGIITIILATQFPKAGYTLNEIPLWVMVTAAGAIGLGTMIGGWRVIRTIGTKISRERLSYTQGFAAELSTAMIALSASLFGAPISTTHTLSSAVAGGTLSLHGPAKLNMRTVRLIFSAWVLTLPVAAVLGAVLFVVLKQLGVH